MCRHACTTRTEIHLQNDVYHCPPFYSYARNVTSQQALYFKKDEISKRFIPRLQRYAQAAGTNAQGRIRSSTYQPALYVKKDALFQESLILDFPV